MAFEASARLSSLLLFIVSSTFRSPYDRTRTFTDDFVIRVPVRTRYKIIYMRPHENMSARNAQVHSDDVISTNETPVLIFGPFFQNIAASV